MTVTPTPGVLLASEQPEAGVDRSCPFVRTGLWGGGGLPPPPPPPSRHGSFWFPSLPLLVLIELAVGGPTIKALHFWGKKIPTP